MSRPDYALGSSFDFKFTTRAFATRVPTTLADSPVVVAYPDNSVTELTAGITLTVDFDARAGLHNVRVVATAGNGYAAGTNYALVLTAGTVGGTSVVGEVVGEFSVEAQAALRPTVAGRTLAVDAGGNANTNMTQLDGSAAAAANLRQSTLAIGTGVVGSASTTTSIVTSSMSPTATVIDQFKGSIISFSETTTTVNLRGQRTDITGNTAAGVLACTALTTAPVSGDDFSIT